MKPGQGRDLFNACALLGRLLGSAGASPSLAVATLDGAASALAQLGIAYDASRLPSARASVAEGFFAVTVENERASARHAWDYPACAVRVSRETVAVVAGYPADDGEALADWAARTALAISRAGYKHAVISGSEPARTELTQALSLVGVGLAPTTAETKGWLSSLLKR